MARLRSRGSRVDLSMKRGDIYWADLEPTRGHEQRGRRPVLIVSPDSFNQATQTPVVLPITNGGAFARAAGYSVALVGVQTTGIVRCDQPRALDLGSRDPRRIESLPADLLRDVLDKMLSLFS